MEEILHFFWNRFVYIRNINRSPQKSMHNNHDINSLQSSNVPLRSGWLLKKRDIFAAWRCRFFHVYPGRLEYFIGPQDVMARGIVQLYGAEVVGPKRCNVNGIPDHYSLTVTPSNNNRDRSFRLTSESVGTR